MGMWISLNVIQETSVFDANITHNLANMADKAGLYEYLWGVEDDGYNASQLIVPLSKGIQSMRDNPEYYKQFNAPNGWGEYEGFIHWLENLLIACINNPEAIIRVSR
jgi:hypothetical protein